MWTEGESFRMARAKKKQKEEEDPWAYYRSIQLTPEERAELRAQAQVEIDRARADGAYERLAAMRGKIKWQSSDDEVGDRK